MRNELWGLFVVAAAVVGFAFGIAFDFRTPPPPAPVQIQTTNPTPCPQEDSCSYVNHQWVPTEH